MSEILYSNSQISTKHGASSFFWTFGNFLFSVSSHLLWYSVSTSTTHTNTLAFQPAAPLSSSYHACFCYFFLFCLSCILWLVFNLFLFFSSCCVNLVFIFYFFIQKFYFYPSRLHTHTQSDLSRRRVTVFLRDNY